MVRYRGDAAAAVEEEEEEDVETDDETVGGEDEVECPAGLGGYQIGLFQNSVLTKALPMSKEGYRMVKDQYKVLKNKKTGAAPAAAAAPARKKGSAAAAAATQPAKKKGGGLGVQPQHVAIKKARSPAISSAAVATLSALDALPPAKPKRVLSEKQLAALARGREENAKKRELMRREEALSQSTY